MNPDAGIVADLQRYLQEGRDSILRETIDGQAGRDHEQTGDEAAWAEYVATVQAAADAHR